MTLAEAYDYLDLLIDKADQPYFIDSEKDMFLELAIPEFINKYYNINGLNEKGKSVFKGIIKSVSNYAASGGVIPNYIPLPEDYLYALFVRVFYDDGGKDAESSDIRALFSDEDPFHKPTKDSPVYTYYTSMNNTPNVMFAPVLGATGVEVYYLSLPGLTTVFGVLPVFTGNYEREIIQIAARKMIANIESSNYEAAQQEADQAS